MLEVEHPYSLQQGKCMLDSFTPDELKVYEESIVNNVLFPKFLTKSSQEFLNYICSGKVNLDCLEFK